MVEIPGYSIESELGRGGMATVYLAVQESVERRVALKVMSPVLLVDRSFSERFIREAKIAANLYHPHIVAVHDVGVHEDQHFIAMEYLAGADLSERCGGDLDIATTVRVCREMAGALHYAHSKGFVHRDVKPENILFREDGTAVLSDFGIARATNSATQMTKTGAVIGTPQYMSPEQARGKELDGRSDLYSLGIVFYEMLTGSVPFQGSDSIAVGIQHVTEPVPRLPDKIAHFQPVLDKFLAKNAEDRYQTGGEAVQDLQSLEQRIVSGEVAKLPPDPGGRSARQTRVSEPPLRAPVNQSKPVSKPANVSATPRPDGSLRQEPKLGQIGDIGSFDRTLGQPRYDPDASPKKKSAWRWLAPLVLVVAALGAAAWWRWDLVSPWLPDREVDALLSQAKAAQDFDRWYGDTAEFANVLYQQVLARDPGNRQASAGIELVALHLCDLAERALVDGNPRQAELLIERAAELVPQLPRIAELKAKISGPGEVLSEQPEPLRPEVEPRPDPAERITALLAEARALMDGGQLVRPPAANALAKFREVLELDSENAAARAGREQILGQLRSSFDQALKADALDQAESLYGQLALAMDDDAELKSLRGNLNEAQARASERQRAAAQRAERLQGLLAEGRQLLGQDRLAEPSGDNAIARFRAVLKEDPENAEARSGLDQVARRYLVLTESALEADRLDEAEGMIQQIEDLRPKLPGLVQAKRRLDRYREQNLLNQVTAEDRLQIERLLVSGRLALDENRLMSPPGESAYDAYKAVQRIDPANEDAQQGLSDLSQRLLVATQAELAAGSLERALAFFNDAVQVDPNNENIQPLRAGVAAAVRGGVRDAIGGGDLAAAEKWLQVAAELDPQDPDVAKLQLEFNIARDQLGGG